MTVRVKSGKRAFGKLPRRLLKTPGQEVAINVLALPPERDPRDRGPNSALQNAGHSRRPKIQRRSRSRSLV